MVNSILSMSDNPGWIRGDDLPPVTNTTLVASSLDLLFPGMSDKYGADSIVDIYVNCTSLHNFTSSAARQELSFKGTANVQFWPRFNGTTELAVELSLIDLDFIGGMQISGHEASGNVACCLVNTVEVVSSTLGSLSA